MTMSFLNRLALRISCVWLLLWGWVVMPVAADDSLPYPPTATLEEVEQRIDRSPKKHPRLFGTPGEFEDLARQSASDPFRKQLAAAIIRHAESLLPAPPVERRLEGRRLLSVSRTCADRVLTLATAYHLTKDRRYLERCQTEMLAAARFRNWNPSHFLDVAEMTAGLAVGYDWLYDHLDADARLEIREAIVAKALRLQFTPQHNGWVRRKNNWGQVCHGGMTIGALAVLEDEPELAAKTVHSAIHNVLPSMSAYAPRGGYAEGPSYWSYGTSYNVAMIAALESVLGSDFGLTDAPGFRETAAFPALACGPSGLFFNYSDGHSARGPSAIHFWFAKRFGDFGVQAEELSQWKKAFSTPTVTGGTAFGRFWPLALLWAPAGEGTTTTKLPLSWSSGGNTPVVVHRSSWNDPNATFVGIKGGSPASSHGQMDIGSFVFDSDGLRWALDLGIEGYHGIESRGMSLWKRAQGSDRWRIFRLNNFGHNTLVINNELQNADGTSQFEQFSDSATRPSSVLNMSVAYEGQASSVRRGIMLLESREVIIQDEIVGLAPGSVVRWGMVTSAVPGELDHAVAKLQQEGKHLRMTIVEPKSTGWKQVNTEQPPNEWDSANPGTRMIALEAPAPTDGTLRLRVVLTPGSCTSPIGETEPVLPLSEWRLP